MNLNLIQFGAIVPQNISLSYIAQQVAFSLSIPTSRILRLEYWQHQLWIHISGIGGRIFSYRRLPAWISQAITAIKNCTTLEQLQQLGTVFNLENQRFKQYYGSENMEKLRQTWSEQREDLQKQEEKMKPIREHQQAAKEWLESWHKIIQRCQSAESLKVLATEIKAQSVEFEDLPEIMAQMKEICEQRWQELS